LVIISKFIKKISTFNLFEEIFFRQLNLYRTYNVNNLRFILYKETLNHYIKIRNLFHLPVRGQRTHTNAKTKKQKFKKQKLSKK